MKWIQRLQTLTPKEGTLKVNETSLALNEYLIDLKPSQTLDMSMEYTSKSLEVYGFTYIFIPKLVLEETKTRNLKI